MRKILFFVFHIFLCLLHLEGYAIDEVKTKELKDQVQNIVTTIEGWSSKEKAANFFDLVLEVKPDTCVDIGVFGGASVFPVAVALKYLQKGKIIGIDPWDNQEAIKYLDPKEFSVDIAWWGQINLEKIYDSYLKMLNKYELNDYCMTIRKSSEEASQEIESIDILHIDGNHSEESIKLNILLYLPKVRSEGYVWLNNILYTNTQAALDLLLEACDVVKLIDSGNCILFKKR